MKLLHLSDLHNKFDVLKSIGPECILVITGDITDNGSLEEYEQAFIALEPFIGHIFICPGNHDFGKVGNFYSKERAECFDKKLSIPLGQHGFFSGDNIPIVNTIDDVRFIALDTNLETYTPFDFACGEIGSRQLSELDKILDKSKDKIKVLFFHHHPFVFSDPFMELKDARELAQIVYGRVDIMLFGHKHKRGYWKDRWGIPHILASDKSPRSRIASEIIIENGKIEVNYMEV